MFTTGTATNHNGLLDALRDFLVETVGWDELMYTPGVAATDVAYMVLRAPAASSGNEFFLYVDTNYNVGLGQYGWAMRAMADYDSDLPIGSQILVSPIVYFNTWEDDIDYWFYANNRRVVVVAKVNTSYVSMYAGCFLPFALPTEYVKPFYLAGNYPQLASYDVSNTRNRFIADPGDLTAYYMKQDLTGWTKVNNHSDGSSTVNFPNPPTSIIWPHRGVRAPATTDSGITSWNNNGMLAIRPNNAGEMPNFLCHIYSRTERKLVGALEGVYGAPGFGRTSEQLIEIGDRDFRLFQNVFRTTPRDFMAIEEA